MASISSRIFRSSFILSVFAVLGVLVLVMLASEDLEDTMLKLDFTAQRDFILQNSNTDEQIEWNTATLYVLYLPDKLGSSDRELPAMFRDRGVPYAGEHEIDAAEFLVNIERVGDGTLYMGRDITLFEKREGVFVLALMLFGVVVIGLTLVIAYLTSRRVTGPLLSLSEDIRRLPVSAAMPRVNDQMEDDELRAIARTFNGFLSELESFVRREQALISLASHELRTPISVIAGAIEVLERRNTLSEKDRATLARISLATSEMHADVQSMLALARRSEGNDEQGSINLAELIAEILGDMNQHGSAVVRVTVARDDNVTIIAERMLAKMAIRNLVQNALQHTTGQIVLEYDQASISVTDHGSGLSSRQVQVLGDSRAVFESDERSGLGLYIVTLACERLGWHLTSSAVPGKSASHAITLHFEVRKNA